MTAFVAGATGYTGRELVRVLREGGHGVVAHVRPDSSRVEEWRERFGALGAEIDTSPWEEAALTEALARHAPSVVYALLGTTRARGRASEGRDSYESVDYALTALLLRAAAACGARPRFVYLSAIGASPKSSSAYLEVRGRVEGELRASGLPFTIVRPAFITGPDRDDGRLGERVGAGLLDGGAALLGLFSSRAARYKSLTNVALARALARVGFDPGCDGRVLHADELGA